MDKKRLFSIGKLSKLTGVHVQSLRYYETIGILKPAYIDPESHYRYYTFSQTRIVEAIQYCVELDIPLKNFRAFLSERDGQIDYSGLLEHGRKQQQRQIGAQCHQVVKRKNPDQAFAEEIFGTFFRGKHDHESADTKKDVHTESSEVQKTDMLKYHKKSSQTA